MKSEMIKLGLIGYGTMGREIDAIASANGFVVTDRIDLDNPLDPNNHYEFDIAVDFSYPKAVLPNLEILAAMGKDIVIGATGWYDELERARQITEKSDVGVVWGSNFSIGMQIMFKLTQAAARYADKFPEYDVFMQESHHKRKKDSPSGTAISLAEIIIKESSMKSKIAGDLSQRSPDHDELCIGVTRGGEVPGTHSVFFDSIADTIEIKHTARNRGGLAKGALFAAKSIYGRKGFFEFPDLFIW